MIYALHHASAFVGAALTAAALLQWTAWTRRHPRAAVALWHLLVLTCVLSAFGFLISIALPALRLGVVPALGALGRGEQSLKDLTAAETMALAGAVGLALGVAGTYAYSTLRARRAQSRQRLLLDLVANRRDGRVTVVDHGAPLVYALPGREPRIVATTAAIHVLTPPEFDAVLAHECQHLAARHDLMILPFAMLRRFFRDSPIFLAIESEVDLLLELCADDGAVRSGHGRALRSALAVFAEAQSRAARPGDEPVAATPVTTRLKRLDERGTGPRTGPALIGYASALTFLSTTLSLYVLPL